jgi:hypothetical protein
MTTMATRVSFQFSHSSDAEQADHDQHVAHEGNEHRVDHVDDLAHVADHGVDDLAGRLFVEARHGQAQQALESLARAGRSARG